LDEGKSQLSLTRTDVLGVPVDIVTMESATNAVGKMMLAGRNHLIVAVNPEKVIRAQQDPDLFRALKNADLVIPDGIGVVMAARLLGKGRMERVPGSDLMPEICKLAAEQRRSIFLFGAKPEIVSRASRILASRYTGLNIAGLQHGYVPEDKMEGLINRINTSGASILFVGLGSPRQELWLARYGKKLRVRICQGVGGSFDAICGYPKRAPKFMQKMHLEWLYRLLSQPQRMHRQLALPKFAAQVLGQLLFRNL
jgi:N-acetylglucosaminyldiphosphoundecaprenol N-acetyl-beta-D-mannosaminyltransferase